MISHLDIKRSAAEILRSEKIVRCLRHCQKIALQSCDRKTRGAGTSSFFVFALMRSLCVYICMYTPLVLHSTQKRIKRIHSVSPSCASLLAAGEWGKVNPFTCPHTFQGFCMQSRPKVSYPSVFGR